MAIGRSLSPPWRFVFIALVETLKRITAFRELAVDLTAYAGIPPKRLRALARYAQSAYAPRIRQLQPRRRWAPLAAFAVIGERTAIDEGLDVFDAWVEQLWSKAKQAATEQRQASLREFDRAALCLVAAARPLIDDEVTDQAEP